MIDFFKCRTLHGQAAWRRIVIVPVYLLVWLMARLGLLGEGHPWHGGCPAFHAFARGATDLGLAFGLFFWLQIPLFVVMVCLLCRW